MEIFATFIALAFIAAAFFRNQKHTAQSDSEGEHALDDWWRNL